MKRLAILDYMFLFDPTEGWSNGFQFERDLTDFFTAYGFTAEIIEPKGNAGRRVIHLDKIVEMPKLENKPDRGPQHAIKNIQNKLNGTNSSR
jgi:hypothetical protein